MRIVILFSLFIILFHFLAPQETPVAESDTVAVKVSAPRRTPAILVMPKAEVKPPQVQRAPAIEEVDEPVSQADVSENLEPGEGSEFLVEAEQGWLNELRDYLINASQYGEEMFEQYNAENSSYGKEIENISGNASSNRELDKLLRELDERHEQKLREIFGKLYHEVQDLHRSYYESIQHLSPQPDAPTALRF